MALQTVPEAREGTRLQCEVKPETHEVLRVEAARRKCTIGEIVDEFVAASDKKAKRG
jgi:hypothetical protein